MTDYRKQALDFLKSANTEIEIKYVETVTGFPFDDNDTFLHNKYDVTLTRGDYQYTFPFYDSYMNYKMKIEPNEYDVLACLITYDVGEMGDFVNEFGYVITDRKSYENAYSAWHECKTQYKELKHMFGSELLEKLGEIN